MTSRTAAPDRPVVDTEVIPRLRQDLEPFTVDAVLDLLGPVAHAALAREQPLAARLAVARALRSEEPSAALAALFVLGMPVTRRAAERALSRTGVASAARLGLLEADGEAPEDGVRALVDLRPYAAVDALGTASWWVASDLSEHAVGGPLRADHVLGVGGASLSLARCAFRRPVGAALDLGTGCGVQALHAARHSARVTATDLSARALAFARFTLALNGVDADLRQGDLLAPVAGEVFDQVVSNPPFVITPRRAPVPAYVYRDGGAVGDAIVERLVTGMGAVLAPGGTAQLLGNWEHRRGQPWTERVGAWLDRSGLDGWVVQRDLQDPAEYAEMWIRDGGSPDPALHEAQYAAWLADFDERDVEAVGFGLVVLHRPDGDGGSRLRRLEEVPGSADTALGDHLAASLQAQTWLGATDDAAVLATRFRVAPDVTEERYHRPGEEDAQVVLLRQGAGFSRAVRADTALAGLAGACDGELSAGRIAAALAVLLERDADGLVADLLPGLRALIADGFLTLADPA